ncbi:biopolymer transporter ExbD [Notoacmeibacter sp. MSK16QG-6]|nr:biopolymer transporter ExbD [Notoacmeibacter sp. MSK16QG-6]
MTSLIDVIFLLLLFFMLSSTFTRYASVDLGGSGVGKNGGTAPDLLVSLRADGVLVNGIDVEGDLLPALRQHREKGLKRATILVGIGATSQQLVTALEVARSVGLDVVVAR